MPFGFGLKEKKEQEKEELQKPEIKFDAKYCGGHKAYPTRKGVKTKILVFHDRIEMSNDRFLLSPILIRVLSKIKSNVVTIKDLSQEGELTLFSILGLNK